MREAVIDGGIFEEFGFRLRWVRLMGHNIHDLIQVLETAKHHGGPTIIHVMTKKGGKAILHVKKIVRDTGMA